MKPILNDFMIQLSHISCIKLPVGPWHRRPLRLVILFLARKEGPQFTRQLLLRLVMLRPQIDLRRAMRIKVDTFFLGHCLAGGFFYFEATLLSIVLR